MPPLNTLSLRPHQLTGTAQKSRLPLGLPTRVCGASQIAKLTGSRHSPQRLPGLTRFTNSFEQEQLTCSF